jgi:hypothetical protein
MLRPKRIPRSQSEKECCDYIRVDRAITTLAPEEVESQQKKAASGFNPGTETRRSLMAA